jgi:hypothetical protein
MAREWEVTPEATSLDFLNNPYIEPGGPSSRRYWAKEAVAFRPEDLEEFEGRRGTNRRYMRGMNIYLREELRLRRKVPEGLIDEIS